MKKLNNVFRVAVLLLSVAFVLSCSSVSSYVSSSTETEFLSKVNNLNTTVSTLVGTSVKAVFSNGGKTLVLDGKTYEYSKVTSTSSAQYTDSSSTVVKVAIVSGKIGFTIGDDIAIYYADYQE